MGSSFKCYGLERAIELLLADKDKDQGQYGEHNYDWSIVEFFPSKVTKHSELEQYKSGYYSDIYVRPHFPIAFIGWNINFKSLPIEMNTYKSSTQGKKGK